MATGTQDSGPRKHQKLMTTFDFSCSAWRSQIHLSATHDYLGAQALGHQLVKNLGNDCEW